MYKYKYKILNILNNNVQNINVQSVIYNFNST